MASFASIISIIVLLASYGYSVPIEDKFPTSTYPTSKFEFTTGKTIVDNTDRITAHLMNVEESASVPTVKIPRDFVNKYTFTTPATSESHERDSRESSMIGDKFFTSSPFPRTAERPSSNLPPRGFEDNLFFDTTTFRTVNSAEEKFQPKSKRVFESKERDMDRSSSAEVLTTPMFERGSKESTSAESMGKFTGSRVNPRTEETTTRMSSGIKYRPTSESRETDRSSEESKIRGPTKVTPIVPMKGTQTEALIDFQSKSYFKNQPNQKELTQGSTLILFLLAALLFCACLMASAIAIVKNHLTFKRKSRITEMEADLDKQHQYHEH